jgi:hypothetical protein
VKTQISKFVTKGSLPIWGRFSKFITKGSLPTVGVFHNFRGPPPIFCSFCYLEPFKAKKKQFSEWAFSGFFEIFLCQTADFLRNCTLFEMFWKIHLFDDSEVKDIIGSVATIPV